jgi:VHL beta domain
MRTTSISRFSGTATAFISAAAALFVPATLLHAQQTAARMDGAAGYDIACSIQAASGFQDCGQPPAGHTCDVEANYASQPSRESTGITFVNRSDRPVKVYWLNFRGERILYKSLPPGAQLVQQTFVGHNWLVTSSGEQCIGIFETVPQAIVDAGSVAVAPPELPLYEQPSPSDEDLVWTPGFWAWSEDVSDY